MLDSTRKAMGALLDCDPTVTPEERAARLAPNFTPTNPEPLPAPLLSPTETGKLFGGKDRHTLRQWERRGWLVAVRTGAKGKNIVGYTGESVRALLAGKATGKGAA